MKFRGRRKVRIAFRKVLVCLCSLLLVSTIYLRKQLVNSFYNARYYVPGEKSPYIVDVKIEVCYSWWTDCDYIWNYDQNNRLQPWIKITIDKDVDTYISRGFLWKEYLYVLRDYQGSTTVLGDLAMSLERFPLELFSDRQMQMKNGDIEGYRMYPYNHIGQEITDKSGTSFWGIGRRNQPGKWIWKGSGLWCKYGIKPEGIKNIRSFIGDGYIEMRPFWKELVHCLSRGEGEEPISISFESNTSPSVIESIDSQYKKLLLEGSSLNILQLSDLHFGRGRIVGSTNNEFANFWYSDLRQIQFIESVIWHDRPALVVVTGHMFAEDSQPIDFETQTLKIVSPMIKNGIPYVFSWGDEIQQVSKSVFLEFVKKLPFCLNRFVEDDSTNLMLPIISKESQKEIGTIYILDSDVDSAQKFLANQPTSSETLLNLAFQHFPLQEYRPKGSFALVGKYEEKGPLDYLSNTKSLRNTLGEKNVRALSCGHYHTNDCCLFSEGKQQELTNDMWLCYLGVTGYDEECESNVRIFSVDSSAIEITSWKRKIRDPAEVYDYQYIWRNSVQNT